MSTKKNSGGHPSRPPRASATQRSRPKRSKKPDESRNDPSALRLNKILAAAGLGSRREVEELIVQGRVEIDREVITDLACKVDPQKVTIKVDGNVLKRERSIYYAVNKPTGVLSTNKDPDGRMRVVDLVPDTHRVFSVGRLDRSSEGLMLLTNDGDLAQRLAHPRFSIQKVYFVVVAGVITQEELDKLHKGVHLAEGFARIDGAKIKRTRKGCTELEISLSEGKNREIRRILARAGHKVVVLRRIAIGPLKLGQMPVGAARLLTSSEVKALYAISEQGPAKKGSKKSSKGSKGRNKPNASARPGKPGSSSGYRPVDDEEVLPVGFNKRRFPDAGLGDGDMDDDGFLKKLPKLPFDRQSDDDDDDDWGDDDFSLNAGSSDFESDEFGGDDLDDDDFVGHFEPSKSGRVISYDEDESPNPAAGGSSKGPKQGGPRQAGPKQARGGPKSARGGQQSRGAKRGRGGGQRAAAEAEGEQPVRAAAGSPRGATGRSTTGRGAKGKRAFGRGAKKTSVKGRSTRTSAQGPTAGGTGTSSTGKSGTGTGEPRTGPGRGKRGGRPAGGKGRKRPPGRRG